jgi:hypothetical protein
VTVVAAQGAYVEGVAQALPLTDVVWQGRTFTGVDDGALELVQ